jgi:hypothetical protein
MKYFTPELLALGVTEDDEQLNEQERQWDDAGARYVAYLDSVRPHMPPGLRRLDADYYLHDAAVLGMGRQGRLFVMVLRLDTPPYSLLTLHYDLVDDPVILRDALPAGLRTPADVVEWQYDEIERDPPDWRQLILLSNGWEVRLHFRDVQVQEAQALIPAPHVAPTLSPSA